MSESLHKCIVEVKKTIENSGKIIFENDCLNEIKIIITNREALDTSSLSYKQIEFQINTRKLDNVVEVRENKSHIILLLFLYLILRQTIKESNIINKAKNLNTIYKVISFTDSKKLNLNPYFFKLIDIELKIISKQNTKKDVPDHVLNYYDINEKEEIPLVVLFYESVIGRAYLETIHSLNKNPIKIIQLVFNRDKNKSKKIGRFIPKFLRNDYVETIQYKKITYWPIYLTKNYQELILKISNIVCNKLGFLEKEFDNAQNKINLNKYSNNVEKIFINDLKDSLLFSKICKNKSYLLLYTGGGILPSKIFEDPNINILHIHPGYLPTYRGADCLLWTLLLEKYASATAFLMDSGIDTGKIIDASWLPPLNLNCINKYLIKRKYKYRIIYSFIDPWVRSFMLRKILSENMDLNHLNVTKQSKNEGNYLFFMSENLQKYCYSNFDNGASE